MKTIKIRKLDYIAFFVVIFISIYVFIPLNLMDTESIIKSSTVTAFASALNAAIFGTLTNYIFKSKEKT